MRYPETHCVHILLMIAFKVQNGRPQSFANNKSTTCLLSWPDYNIKNYSICIVFDSVDCTSWMTVMSILCFCHCFIALFAILDQYQLRLFHVPIVLHLSSVIHKTFYSEASVNILYQWFFTWISRWSICQGLFP